MFTGQFWRFMVDIKSISTIGNVSVGDIVNMPQGEIFNIADNENNYFADPLQKLIGMVEARINDGSLNHDQNIYVYGQNGVSHDKG